MSKATAQTKFTKATVYKASVACEKPDCPCGGCCFAVHGVTSDDEAYDHATAAGWCHDEAGCWCCPKGAS